MSYVRQYDNRVGITYIYEIIEETNIEANQKKKHRKLIGKVDPETGEIIPTGKRGRSSTGKKAKFPLPPETNKNYEIMYKDAIVQLHKSQESILDLSREVNELRSKYERIRSWLEQGNQIMK